MLRVRLACIWLPSLVGRWRCAATGFTKNGKIAVPNFAMAYVNAYFSRRSVHIRMQQAKQEGNDGEVAVRDTH